MSDLIGRRALVGGASQGIGRATAEGLAARGCSVTLLARNVDRLSDVLAGLAQGSRQEHATLAVDYREPENLKARVEDALRQMGPHAILINNTGGPRGGEIAAATADEFRDAFQTHLLCNQLLTQLLLPGMRSEGYGRIVNIVSTSVREPIPGLGVSNTIRAAVAGWAKTLAGELAPLGITVNNVLPGYTETARLRDLIQRRAQAHGVADDQIERAMKSQTPMGRFATPQEVAAAVVFLASPAASYITGVSLPVDGGRIGSI